MIRRKAEDITTDYILEWQIVQQRRAWQAADFRCHKCLHKWHGLPCNDVGCTCTTCYTPDEH